MKSPTQRCRVEFDDVVRPAKAKRRAATQRTRAYYRDASVPAVAEARIQELGPVLMPLKPQTESAVDEILEDAGVHVIELYRRAFGIVMPNCDAQPVIEPRVSQSDVCLGYAAGVYSPLFVEHC